MTDAWRNLAAAAIRFNKGLCNQEAVIDAWVASEQTIGDVSYQQTGGSIKQRDKTIGPTNKQSEKIISDAS